MHNERINILVAPTFFCERHCKYCMYHDLTWDKEQLTIDQIMSSIDDLLYKVAGNLGSVNIEVPDRMLAYEIDELSRKISKEIYEKYLK